MSSPDTQPPAPSPPSLAHRAVRGVRLMTAAVALSKGLSLLAQIVVGWKMTSQQVGLYYSALSVYAIAAFAKDLSLSRLLVQRSRELDRIGGTAQTMALIVNAGLALLVIAVAAVVEVTRSERDGITLLAAVLALGLLFSPLTLVPLARLQADLRFGRGLWATLADMGGRYGLVILLALLGVGPLALAIGATAALVAQAIACQILVPGTLQLRLQGDVARGMLHDVKWLVVGALGTAAINSGDYFVLTQLADLNLQGLYSFGFQLTSAMATLFGGSLLGVLMPALATIRDNPVALARATRRSVGLISLAAALASMLAAVTSPVLIHLAWGGRWDGSIPTTVIISLSMGSILVGVIGYSVMEALGRWKLRATVMILDGVGVTLATVVGLVAGGERHGLLAVSICVAVYRAASAMGLVAVGATLAGASRRQAVGATLSSTLIAVAAAAAGLGACRMAGIDDRTLAGGALATGVASAVWLGLSLLLMRALLLDAFTVLVPARLRAKFGQKFA